jgi:hypothetical protein
MTFIILGQLFFVCTSTHLRLIFSFPNMEIYTLVLLDIDINNGKFNQRELSYKESSLLHSGSFVV